MITFDWSFLQPEIHEDELKILQPSVEMYHHQIHQATCVGSDFLGWVTLPSTVTPHELEEIRNKAALAHSSEIETVVVIGIGGSYLGSRAIIEALNPTYRKKIVYLGHHLSSHHYQHLLSEVNWSKTMVNVISKSGTTTEPALAFRLVLDAMEKSLGKDSQALKERIIATTDPEKGALRRFANERGWTSFVVPDNVGGRFSVLTAVGLLPVAMAGVDIFKIIEGAREMQHILEKDTSVLTNPSYRYAAIRNLAYQKGYQIEKMVSMHPQLGSILGWWEQLYGESEGKNHKGIFPSSGLYTTDLHSLGQYMQDGRRFLMETFLDVAQDIPDVMIPHQSEDYDGFNSIAAGKSLEHINRQAFSGTIRAHRDGGVPISILRLESISERNLGSLLYFFMKGCAMSGLLLGVNPFDQPGVEAYKKEMKILLNKH